MFKNSKKLKRSFVRIIGEKIFWINFGCDLLKQCFLEIGISEKLQVHRITEK